MPKNDTSSTHSSETPVLTGRTALIWAGRLVVGLAGLAVAGVACVLIAVGIALAVAYPNLPEVAGLADYRPKLPLRHSPLLPALRQREQHRPALLQ